MVVMEFLISAFIVGIILHGLIGGWRGFKERQEESGGGTNSFSGQNEPFYWMTIGSWQNKDHANVNENTNDSNPDPNSHSCYDYDGHIDF